MGVFGGGMGATGESCGALIGSLAVLGLKYGRRTENETEERTMWFQAMKLVKRFREEVVQNHGSICCRDITKIDWLNREQVISYYKPDEKFFECARIIGDTSKILGETLEEKINLKVKS